MLSATRGSIARSESLPRWRCRAAPSRRATRVRSPSFGCAPFAIAPRTEPSSRMPRSKLPRPRTRRFEAHARGGDPCKPRASQRGHDTDAPPCFRFKLHARPAQTIAARFDVGARERNAFIEKRSERTESLGCTTAPRRAARTVAILRGARRRWRDDVATRGSRVAHERFVSGEPAYRPQNEHRANRRARSARDHLRLRSIAVMRWQANSPNASEHPATPSTIQPSGCSR